MFLGIYHGALLPCRLQSGSPYNPWVGGVTYGPGIPHVSLPEFNRYPALSISCRRPHRQTEVRQEASRALALFASKRDSQPHLVRSGIIPKLVSFVRSSDVGVRRYGVLGLGNLAVVNQNHQTLFEAGGVPSLLMESVYASEDLETRRCVAFALNNIASYEPNHRVCEKIGVLRPLVQLLRDPDPDTHLQAAFAIRQLSVTARCRSQLVEMKGLTPLLRREDEKVNPSGMQKVNPSGMRTRSRLFRVPL